MSPIEIGLKELKERNEPSVVVAEFVALDLSVVRVDCESADCGRVVGRAGAGGRGGLCGLRERRTVHAVRTATGRRRELVTRVALAQ